MVLKNKQDNNISNENNKRVPNVRQLQTNSQNQILSALDTLGAKLVRSETERETMKRLLNEALDAQERLENQLERSHIDMQRRIDKLDQVHEIPHEFQTLLDEQSKLVADGQKAFSDYESRQIRVEDKVNDSHQTIAKLQRRLDAQEQKRAKLQRRIERVENIAAEAQNALAAKSLVLLTDQSRNLQALPHIDATGPMQVLNDLHGVHDDKSSARSLRIPALGAVLLCGVALGLGWLLAANFNGNDKAFVMMQDGTMRQLDFKTGSSRLMTSEQTVPPSSPVQPSTTQALSSNIESDLALLSTDWITQDILDEAMVENITPEAVVEQVSPPTITIGRDPSLPPAMQSLEDKAFNGLAEAQHDLGALYTGGQGGVAQNYERAAYWFKQSADQGIANAAYNLGVLYHQGLGQAQDIERALDWYRRAAQLGHPEAQYNLGIAYIEGIGTRYNPNMAAAFFQQAALGGIVEAAYNLGLILENGLLGEVRPMEAMRWYRGAAENGSADAQAALTTLATRMNLPEDEVGYLDDGATLTSYIAAESGIAADEAVDAPDEVKQDIGLGTLVPTRAQIVVAQIQEQLKKMNYYDGPQDGIVGAGTVKSIKSYQIKEGLIADGLASEKLLSYMLSKGTN